MNVTRPHNVSGNFLRNARAEQLSGLKLTSLNRAQNWMTLRVVGVLMDFMLSILRRWHTRAGKLDYV